MKRLLFMTMLFVLVASASAFAAWQYDGDIGWGENHGDGHWGITYIRGLDDDEGSMKTWFNIHHKSSRYHKKLEGAYTEPGQSVTTLFGNRLGVNYSPYTAQFPGWSAILGVRVYGYEFGNVAVDGTYVFGSTGSNQQNDYWQGPDNLKVTEQDFILGARTTLGQFNLRGAALRHKVGGDHFWNYSMMVENSEVYPGIVLNGVYAFYGAKEDWLYELTADWKVNPGILEVRAGYRDSEIESVDSNEVRGCVNCGGQDWRYIDDAGRDAIYKIYNRDRAYNVGATTWFNFNGIINQLDVDFTNTNPNHRGDLDDQLGIRLQSDIHEFKVDQRIDVLFFDDTSTAREHAYEDEKLPRYDYRLGVTSPDYFLPYDVIATGLFNYDWDKNHQVDPREHAIVGVRLERTQNIYTLPNVKLEAILAVDMPGRTTPVLQDPFKYALRASYTAPNKAQFRLDYVSSKDFNMSNTSVHGEQIYKRYDRYRLHGTENHRERFDGIRFVFALPF